MEPVVSPLILVGGCAASAVLGQALADVLQREVRPASTRPLCADLALRRLTYQSTPLQVRVPNSPAHVAALGAAALAAATVAHASSAGERHGLRHPARPAEQKPERRYHSRSTPSLRAAYEAGYQRFVALHPSLEGRFL
jgi:sugar (pentulose or hexulose) kinase